MRSYPATTHRRPQFAGEVAGGWDASPLDAVATLVQQKQAIERALVDAWREVAAWSGTAPTTGLTQHEWLTLVGRLSSRDARRLEQLASRLSALPVTASLLASGQLTVDQASQICAGTTALSGEDLAHVDRLAAEHAADRNRRGDAPDVDVEVDRLVQERRKPRDVEQAERRAIEGSRVHVQQGLDGGGLVVADLAPVEFATVVAAIEDAAGRPDRDVPRRSQRAAGLVAMSDRWLTGDSGGAARAKPNITLTIDLADATPAAFAQVWRSGAGRHAPHLSARLTDVLSCTTDVDILVTDGAQPLIRLKDRVTVPQQVRAAVLHRDRGCRWPSCTAPPWQADVHHLRHRADGGDHSVQNLVTLCRRHHARLHGTHWTATLDPTTAALHLSHRRDGSNPVHTTLPHGTHPARAASPPEVAVPR